MKKYGLVLSGGGTRGAYEIGAHKALKELKIPITGVVGCSIGALNAALILQQDEEKIDRLYETIQLSDVMPLEKGINTQKDIFAMSNIMELAKQYCVQKGLDNAPLRNMIEQYLDVDKVYESELDFGIIAYSVDGKHHIEMFKQDIPKEKLVEYLLASCCFPIYKSQEIDGKKYFDGGLYDNMPINALIDRGYKDIIAIDLAGPGITKSVKKNVNLKLIKCRENMGGVFDFNKDTMKRNITLGYLDTMKAFNKLEGHRYYFLKKEFSKLLNCMNLETIYGLEMAAEFYGMNRYQCYTKKAFLKKLTELHKEAEDKYSKIKKKMNFSLHLIRSIPKVFSMIDKGVAICFFKEMLYRIPSSNFSMREKIFSRYVSSAKAMIELEMLESDQS